MGREIRNAENVGVGGKDSRTKYLIRVSLRVRGGPGKRSFQEGGVGRKEKDAE